MRPNHLLRCAARWLLAAGAACSMAGAHAGVTGISGSRPAPRAASICSPKRGYLSMADGVRVYSWGYGAPETTTNGTGRMQVSGPTLLVNQGETVTVNFTNRLPARSSIVFPGQSGVSTSGGSAGALTAEVGPNESVSYTFTAAQPGTYLYQSGTQSGLQVEMGLVGALIVYPAGNPLGAGTGAARTAYGHAGTGYERETLLVVGDIDPDIHAAVDDRPRRPPHRHHRLRHERRLHLHRRPGAPFPGSTGRSTAAPRPTYCAQLCRRAAAPALQHAAAAAPGRTHPAAHGRRAATCTRCTTTATTRGDRARRPHAVERRHQGPEPGDVGLHHPRRARPDLRRDLGLDRCRPRLGCSRPALRRYGPADLCVGLSEHGRPLPAPASSGPGQGFPGAAAVGVRARVRRVLQRQPVPRRLGIRPVRCRRDQHQRCVLHYMFHSHNEREVVNGGIFPGGMMTMMVIEPPGITID